LICVVDVSGSMAGRELELVQQTLKSLISLMKVEDRLALIVFNDKSQLLTNFKAISGPNNILFTEIILKAVVGLV